MDMKKKLLGLSVIAALGVANAYAAPGVLFDATGASLAGTFVDTFTWAPDNALFVNAAPGGSLAPTTLLVVGKLSSATNSGGGPAVVIPPGGAFTFELSIPLRVSTAGTGLAFTFDPLDKTAANDYFIPAGRPLPRRS